MHGACSKRHAQASLPTEEARTCKAGLSTLGNGVWEALERAKSTIEERRLWRLEDCHPTDHHDRAKAIRDLGEEPRS
jgi:hypothetical protein